MADERRMSFNRVAELYDEVRPGYPDALITDILELSGIPPGGRIIEVGCGTGQATVPFAERGYHMVCLELGDRLAALAAGKLARFQNVTVTNSAFEEWTPEAERFDLAISGTAFHWIVPDIGYPRAAEALKPGGTLALFWNFHVQPDTEPFASMQAHYRRHAPSMAEVTSWEDRLRERRVEFEESGRFGPVQERLYPWESEVNADEYIRGMGTQSDHIMLEPDARAKLFAGIRSEIVTHGGVVRQPWVTALLLARTLQA